MALAYPFVGAVMTESAPPPVLVPVPSTAVAAAGPLTLLPKPFASDIDMKDNGFGTRDETLEEEDEVDFGKGSGGGVDIGGNDDDEDEDEEEDEKVLIVVEVVARVDELND
jgi:hypothetical protein